MITHKGRLSMLVNLGVNTTTGKIPGITHGNDRSLHISFKEDIMLMFKAPDAFIKNYQKAAHIHESVFYRYSGVLVDVVHACHSGKGKYQFPTFGMFLETNIW